MNKTESNTIFGERDSSKEARGNVCVRRRHITQPLRRMVFNAHPILTQVSPHTEISVTSKKSKEYF